MYRVLASLYYRGCYHSYTIQIATPAFKTQPIACCIQLKQRLLIKKANRFNDLIRLSPGIGYKFESGLKTELYAIYNISRNITETNNASSDFILRLRIYREKTEEAAPLAPSNEFEEEEGGSEGGSNEDNP